MTAFTPSTYGHSMQAAKSTLERKALSPRVIVTVRHQRKPASCQHCGAEIGSAKLQVQCPGNLTLPTRVTHASVHNELVATREDERIQLYVPKRGPATHIEAALTSTYQPQLLAPPKPQHDESVPLLLRPKPRAAKMRRLQPMERPQRNVERMPLKGDPTVAADLAAANAWLHNRGAR